MLSCLVRGSGEKKIIVIIVIINSMITTKVKAVQMPSWMQKVCGPSMMCVHIDTETSVWQFWPSDARLEGNQRPLKL